MDRRIDGFFYGLFMDKTVLGQFKVKATNPRKAQVEGFELRIGNKATLVAKTGAKSYGMLYSLTHEDLNKLYHAPGLVSYKPEAIVVHTLSGEKTPALCYNLDKVPGPDEANEEYAKKLSKVLTQLEFPEDYIASIF